MHSKRQWRSIKLKKTALCSYAANSLLISIEERPRETYACKANKTTYRARRLVLGYINHVAAVQDNLTHHAT